jgi:hypothetical protein
LWKGHVPGHGKINAAKGRGVELGVLLEFGSFLFSPENLHVLPRFLGLATIGFSCWVAHRVLKIRVAFFQILDARISA